MKRVEVVRFGIVVLGICFLYFVIVTRLFYWQVVRSEELKDLQRLQSSEKLSIPATRGQILSADDFPLATNTISYTFYANPKVIKEKNDYAEKIAPLLKDDPASISALLSKDLFWVKLAGKVSPEVKDEISRLSLKGIGFEQEYSRFYPEASLAAQLVGFVGKDGRGGDKGYFGIEGYYNEQLAGRSGGLYAIRDALGNQILSDVRQEQKIDGRSVKLTIDRTIAFIADKRLSEGVEKYNADGGNVIIMEPESGKILAMSSYPRFDPQKYYEFDPKSYVNPALSNLYEPGSTFKVLIMGAALDLGVVKLDTRCNICGGSVQIGEYKIKTWNDKYFPNTTMNDVIVHSDNTGMVFAGRKIGIKNMVSYFKKFGLGELTGIDVQGEGSGTIREENQWYAVDLATASFGQGISLTPIQLISAVNSIANGGKLMTPYVVSQIIDERGRKIDIQPKFKNKTISNAAAKSVTAAMVAAVESGEAKWTKIKNYKIAGKTGTAQIPVAGHYDPNQTVTSFVGFFPPENPRFTMLVTLSRPKTSIYGSETAAPIFFSIARDLIKYYNLPPN